jgi:hypothetical protein
MARLLPLRRSCPEIVKSRIDQAKSMQLYVVQEMGPMAFIIRDSGSSSASDAKADGAISTKEKEAKKMKVGLGSRQTCNCHHFMSENELCVHIVRNERGLYQRTGTMTY